MKGQKERRKKEREREQIFFIGSTEFAIYF